MRRPLKRRSGLILTIGVRADARAVAFCAHFVSLFGTVNKPSDRPELSALLTDLYQLTMAYGYWKTAAADRDSVFHLYFRKQPFAGGFAVCAGLEQAVRFLTSLRFTDSDLDYLRTLKGVDGKPLFENDFLQYLRLLEWRLDLDAVTEGTVVFPHEPLLRVRGPILQAQTKSSRPRC
jgi:nicotinic acid phosphoribosyltransferase